MNIHIKNIVKQYNNSTVLDIEDLEINSGRITGIIGPNGSGKTTLLKIISNIIKAEKGSIFFDGEAFNKNILKKITYVHQFPYMLSTNVFNNIAYPLKLRKKNKDYIQKNVYSIMKELNILNLKDKYAKNLSGGEAQKVAFARALVFLPDVLLLDEPTSNIDLQALELIENKIKEINSRYKMTIIIVTHNVSQAKRICDEILYLEEGNLLDKLKPKELDLDNCSKNVRKFLSLNM